MQHISKLSGEDFKNGKLNLKPRTLREPIHKFKKFKFKSPSSGNIKGECWGKAVPVVMASGWSVGQCCAMPGDGISAWDWTAEGYLEDAQGVGSIQGLDAQCLVVESCEEALKKG